MDFKHCFWSENWQLNHQNKQINKQRSLILTYKSYHKHHHQQWPISFLSLPFQFIRTSNLDLRSGLNLNCWVLCLKSCFCCGCCCWRVVEGWFLESLEIRGGGIGRTREGKDEWNDFWGWFLKSNGKEGLRSDEKEEESKSKHTIFALN